MFSEQDVDRELKAALSVSPVAGLRGARPAARRGGSAVALAGALRMARRRGVARHRRGRVLCPEPAACVVAPVPAPQIVEHTAPRVIVTPPETTVPAQRTGEGRDGRGPALRRPVTHRARRAAHVAPAPRTAEPEVLVPVNQMEAVRRLVRAVNEGRLEAPAEPPEGPMAPPPALDVAPVVVEPIPLSPLGPAAETATPFIRGLK